MEPANCMKMKDKVNIFLYDALGATVSIIGLLLIYYYEEFFGMPKRIVSMFTYIAFMMATYSFVCYFMSPKNWKRHLKRISVINILYCLLTIYLLNEYSNQITTLGFLYFTGEILIVLFLSFYEIRISNKNRVLSNPS